MLSCLRELAIIGMRFVGILACLSCCNFVSPPRIPANGDGSGFARYLVDRDALVTPAPGEISLADELVSLFLSHARCDLGHRERDAKRGQYRLGRVALYTVKFPQDDRELERFCEDSHAWGLCSELRNGCTTVGSAIFCDIDRFMRAIDTATVTYMALLAELQTLSANPDTLFFPALRQEQLEELARPVGKRPKIKGVYNDELLGLMREGVIAALVGHEFAHVEQNICGRQDPPPVAVQAVGAAYQRAMCTGENLKDRELEADVRGIELTSYAITLLGSVSKDVAVAPIDGERAPFRRAIQALRLHPFALVGRAIENTAEVEMVLRIPPAERQRVVSAEPKVRKFVALDVLGHALRAASSAPAGSDGPGEGHAFGQLGKRLLLGYWQETFHHGAGREVFVDELNRARSAAGGHMITAFRMGLLVGTLANVEPLVGAHDSTGGETQGGGWAEQDAVVDEIGVRLWGALLGGLQRMQASSSIPECKARSDEESEQAVRLGIASSTAAVRAEVNAIAAEARTLLDRAKAASAGAIPDSQARAPCRADEVLVGPECAGASREGPGCHCGKWDSLLTGSIIGSLYLQSAYTRTNQAAGGHSAAASAAAGLSGLMYYGSGNVTGRVELVGSVGGGQRGLEGTSFVHSMIGRAFFAPDLDEGSSMVLRGGFTLALEADSAYHQSLLELPSLEIAYHLHRGATQLEIGGRLGLALAGRMEIFSGEQGLGVGGDVGLYVDVITRRIWFGARLLEEGIRVQSGPATVSDAVLCLRLLSSGSLCAEGRLERTDGSSTGGRSRTMQFVGLRFGRGEYEFL